MNTLLQILLVVAIIGLFAVLAVRHYLRRAKVEFANIGEGTHEHGVKSFLPDAITTARYLLYKKGATQNSVALTTLATDYPLGSSDDQADDVAMPIAIKLFGAVKGTVRVVSDGTLTDGCRVGPSAVTAGFAASVATGNCSFGIALIGTDQNAAGISAAGDLVEIIPALPAKYAF